MKKICCLRVLLLLLFSPGMQAQLQPTSAGSNSEALPCISADAYTALTERCTKNAAALHWTSPQPVPLAVTPLHWPLRAAANLTDCGFYYVSAYVDHDNTSAAKDYACGTNTYNGHRGTDIAIGPYPIYKMDNDQVEIVAAAAGIILDKHDGEYDKNCVGSGSNLPANYVIIQHADGSRALYWHMKKNKVTTKAIGQPVAIGEYLGIVGSSGSSGGPHLHFEVWAGSSNTTAIDPYAGTCNLLNANSWWASQKPYTEPAVLKVSVNTTDIILPACPTLETRNESGTYVMPFQGPGLAAGYAKFYLFLRNESGSTSATLRILAPDGSVYLSWTQNIVNGSRFSIYGFSKKLPLQPGTYSFEASYQGTTCTQPFRMIACGDAIPIEWTGNSSTDWWTAANWSCGAVPGDSKDIIINSIVPFTPVLLTTADCKSISLLPGAVLQVQPPGKLTVLGGH